MIDPEKLDRLAAVAVRVGVNLQPGQELVLLGPAEARPLILRIARAAYGAGAALVTALMEDEEVTLARFRHASHDGFDRGRDWFFEGIARAMDEGAALLRIAGGDPALLSGEDPERVSRAERANTRALRPMRERITSFAAPWTIVSYPVASWARRIFPGLSDDEAVGRLAEAVFAASRLAGDDPVAGWAAHNAALRQRCAWLDARRFRALRFRGPGTDLTVGLPRGHRWLGGAERSKTGIVCNPNIPTEEVFTTPDAATTEGHVTATKPLSHAGALIEGIRMRFEAGRIVEASAAKGQEVLRRVLDTDEGARRLGEVALVPESSPIARSGLLFYNTLYDENAASHIALGQCYSVCLEGGERMSPEEVAAAGGNRSAIHIDWMIGSGEIEIDGVTPEGEAVPVMRAGEWS
jgi:aminopeptidase